MSQQAQSPEWAAFRAQIVQKTARTPRTSPAKKRQPKAETANGLTRKIVQHIRQHGGFASRISSTGTYREDIRKFVASQQRAGLPDIYGLLDGRSMWIEVKVGRDVLSEVQKQTISGLIAAGAAVWVARDFDSFTQWFSALLALPNDTDALPFGPAPQE